MRLFCDLEMLRCLESDIISTLQKSREILFIILRRSIFRFARKLASFIGLTLSGLLSRPGGFKMSSTFLDSGFFSTRGAGGGW
jgi:hypothetical protein